MGRDFLSKVDSESGSGMVMCNLRLQSEEASQRGAKHSCCQEPEGGQLGRLEGQREAPRSWKVMNEVKRETKPSRLSDALGYVLAVTNHK